MKKNSRKRPKPTGRTVTTWCLPVEGQLRTYFSDKPWPHGQCVGRRDKKSSSFFAGWDAGKGTLTFLPNSDPSTLVPSFEARLAAVEEAVRELRSQDKYAEEMLDLPDFSMPELEGGGCCKDLEDVPAAKLTPPYEL